MDERDKEILKKRKLEKTWANWLPGYLIYAGGLAMGYPGHCTPFLQYLDVVYKAFTCFTGMAWMHDDEQFRMRAKPNLVDLSHRVHVVQKILQGLQRTVMG